MRDTRNEGSTQFVLASGRAIELVAIDQFPTYEGLLVGVPTREMNQHMMFELTARYLDPAGYGAPLILEPEQTPIDGSGASSRGTPAALPGVTCVARFMSDGLEGSGDIWSSLRVIWYQDEFALPIADLAREQIARIDWEGHANRWEP